MNLRRLMLVLLLGAGAARATAGVLPLNIFSDNDSTYYEYFSNGFFRMDLFSPTRPTNQSFHDIDNPETIFNQNYDGFPNDRNFRFGSVTYDESGLAGGTGLAPITGLTFNVVADPANPTYINWRRFTANAIIGEMSGSVELAAGKPVAVDLSAEFTFEVVGAFSATMTGIYPGSLHIDGDQFTLTAEGMPVLDTVFGTGPFHLKWDFGGQLRTLVPDAGDYNQDDVVDGGDFLLWQRSLGDAAIPAGTGADGDASGMIDGPDLGVWQDRFGFGLGATSPAGIATPEPAAVVLSLLASLGLAPCRRRFRAASALS